MPRPKSEITGPKQIQIATRVTKAMRDEYKRIGGPVWLRKYLAQSIEQAQASNSSGKLG